MIDVAKTNPENVGGLILVSPALNQRGDLLPTAPNPEFDKLPKYIQVGLMEDATPPLNHQKKDGKDMTNQSRLKATEAVVTELLSKGLNNVEFSINSFGHDSHYVLEGINVDRASNPLVNGAGR